MAKMSIVIADSDELFINHLTNYMIERVSTFEVFSFTSKDSLANFIKEGRVKIDILVFAEEFLDEQIKSATIGVKVLLSDGSFSSITDYKSVNKYQKTEKFINDILIIYSEETGHLEAIAHGNKETQTIAFYSPVGGSGKTTLAIASAYAWASRGKRVFYLNAETINSTADVFSNTGTGGMSDVYLSAKTKGANIGLKVMVNKNTDTYTNISYVGPSESSLEINELSNAEFEKMIKEIEGLGEFDIIVVDFDSELNKDKMKLLNVMDRIVVPFSADSRSLCKMGVFLQEINRYDLLQAIEKKLCYVLNKSNGQSGQIVAADPRFSGLDIKANIAYAAVFTDVKTMIHSAQSVVPALERITDMI